MQFEHKQATREESWTMWAHMTRSMELEGTQGAYPVDLMASISLSALVYSRGEAPRQTISSASCT